VNKGEKAVFQQMLEVIEDLNARVISLEHQAEALRAVARVLCVEQPNKKALTRRLELMIAAAEASDDPESQSEYVEELESYVRMLQLGEPAEEALLLT